MEKQRLSYEHVNNSDKVITIDLHNGYRVMAVSGYNKETGVYNTTLLLSDVNIDNWSLIEQAESLEFQADYKTINSTILKQVRTFLESGFFDYYIKRYQFMTACVDSFFTLYDMAQNLSAQPYV